MAQIKIVLDRKRSRGANQYYSVELLSGSWGELTDHDLITHCDNRRSDVVDTSITPPGQSCHFGGHVQPIATSIKQVCVYID